MPHCTTAVDAGGELVTTKPPVPSPETSSPPGLTLRKPRSESTQRTAPQLTSGDLTRAQVTGSGRAAAGRSDRGTRAGSAGSIETAAPAAGRRPRAVRPPAVGSGADPEPRRPSAARTALPGRGRMSQRRRLSAISSPAATARGTDRLLIFGSLFVAPPNNRYQYVTHLIVTGTAGQIGCGIRSHITALCPSTVFYICARQLNGLKTRNSTWSMPILSSTFHFLILIALYIPLRRPQG